MTSYSYSLDREVWLGRFASRGEAAHAGVEHGIGEATPPETIYVGQRVEPNSRAYGHARSVIEAMRRRVHEENGDIADDFLRNPTTRQVSDLDAALEQTIRQWLGRNNLEPSWARFEAVGEYPMPMAGKLG